MKNPNNSSNQNAKPSYDVWKGSYRIAISLAAAAIGLSCIATDASARGGGFGGGIGGGHMGGMAMGGHMGGMNFGAPGIGGRSFAAPGFNRGFYGGAGGGRPGSPPRRPVQKFAPMGPGAPGVSAMQAAPPYAVPSSYSRPVCGYYPYPPCRRQR